MKARKIISAFCALLFCVVAMSSCVGSALEADTTPSIPAESNTVNSLTDSQVPQDIPADGNYTGKDFIAGFNTFSVRYW